MKAAISLARARLASAAARGRLALAPGWPSTIALALVLAFLASTQFLAQPFVWRHWEVDEVLLAWLDIFGERVLVALVITVAAMLALASFELAPNLHRLARAALYTLTIVAAAAAAEWLLVALNTPDAAADRVAFGDHVLRWSSVALAITGLRLAWGRALRTEVAAHRTTQQEQRVQAQLSAVRLQGLQAQIEPHFLFNTLATVKRLGATEPGQCSRLLEHLVDFISLSGSAQPCTRRWRVADELSLAQAYLGVVEVRMSGRLMVRFDIDPGVVELDTPPLALATLVENAVKHGITPSTDGGRIDVAARRVGGRVRLEVADTGIGFRSGGGSGIGLANTRARLKSLYGDDGRLKLAPNLPTGVVAAIEWSVDGEALR
jgi:signal transduction histidine kinase